MHKRWPIERLFFVLRHEPPVPFATGKVEIVLERLGYRYRDRQGREIAGDSAITEEILLEWMKSAGVNSDAAAVRAEASNLLEIAKGAARQSPLELADPVAFTASRYPSPYQSAPPREVTVDPWVVPAVCAFWAIVWLGGCGLCVARAGRKTRSGPAPPTHPHSPDQPANDAKTGAEPTAR